MAGEKRKPEHRPRMGFVTRLAAAMLVAALAPLGVLALVMVLYQQWAITDQTTERFSALASVQEARIEAYLSSNRTAMALVASRTQLRRSMVDLVDGAEAERERITDIITDAQTSSSDITDVTVLDGAGVVLASTRRGEVGDDWSDRAFVDAAGDEVSLSHVESAEDGTLLNIVAGPLELDGARIGTIVVSFDFSRLVNFFQDHIGLGDTGESMLAEPRVDGSARLIAPLRFDRDAALERVETLAEGGPVITAVQGIETTFTDVVDYRGETVVAVTRWLGGVGWGLVVKQDRAEVLAPVQTMRNGLVIAAIGVAIAGMTIAVGMARRLRAPVVELTTAARELTSGDRTRRVSIEGSDELTELAAVFNEMADRLMLERSALETRVRLRTEELSDALEQLSRRNVDLENFTRVLAHDLNNPLAVARTFTTQLATGDLDEKDTRQSLERIDRSLERMRVLVEDVLAYLDSETSDLAEEPVDLGGLVASAIEETGTDVDVEGELPTVLGDPALLRRVFVNLFSNSAKYARDGVPAEVRVRVGRVEERWLLTLTDNGIGVADEERERIFEPFRRGSSVSGRPGTGVGLAICRTVIERHGGRIVCRPDPGGGTVFEIELPDRARQPAQAR